MMFPANNLTWMRLKNRIHFVTGKEAQKPDASRVRQAPSFTLIGELRKATCSSRATRVISWKTMFLRHRSNLMHQIIERYSKRRLKRISGSSRDREGLLAKCQCHYFIRFNTFIMWEKDCIRGSRDKKIKQKTKKAQLQQDCLEGIASLEAY